MKFIITDIDGCISPEESVPWDLERFMAFARLSRDAAEGRGSLPPITLCSGRPQPYVEALLKILAIQSTAMCENGAILYSLQDNTSYYAPGVTRAMIDGLRAVRAHIETAILPDFPAAVLQFGKEANLSVYSATPDVFPAIQARVEEYVQAHGGPALMISPTHFYLNISLDGVDKGSTLRWFLDKHQIAKEDAAGIGDTEGDLPIRDAVGFFACPANAKPAVKAASDYVSPYPDIAGILDILARPEMQKK